MAVTDRHHHRVVSCSRIGVVAAAIAGGLVLAGAAAAAVPAYADPAPGLVPAAGDIVGVGSDTTQDLVGALANAYNNAQGAGAPKAYSWDATPKGSTIVPKSGAPSITRPDGSAAGIKVTMLRLGASRLSSRLTAGTTYGPMAAGVRSMSLLPYGVSTSAFPSTPTSRSSGTIGSAGSFANTPRSHRVA
jgi:hypothetical protein